MFIKNHETKSEILKPAFAISGKIPEELLGPSLSLCF